MKATWISLVCTPLLFLGSVSVQASGLLEYRGAGTVELGIPMDPGAVVALPQAASLGEPLSAPPLAPDDSARQNAGKYALVPLDRPVYADDQKRSTEELLEGGSAEATAKLFHSGTMPEYFYGSQPLTPAADRRSAPESAENAGELFSIPETEQGYASDWRTVAKYLLLPAALLALTFQQIRRRGSKRGGEDARDDHSFRKEGAGLDAHRAYAEEELIY